MSMQKQVIKVNNVKFNNGVIGAIHFVATKRGTVKCVPIGKAIAELPTIRVSQYRDTEYFEAAVCHEKGAWTLVTARTPEKAFRRAVKNYWVM